MAKIKPGDWYRITIEGQWDADESAIATKGLASLVHGDDFLTDDSDIVTVEKIEPPVEIFRPGDVVRSRELPTTILALSKKGYTYVGANNRGLFLRYERGSRSPEEFTSEDYEKVSLD